MTEVLLVSQRKREKLDDKLKNDRLTKNLKEYCLKFCFRFKCLVNKPTLMHMKLKRQGKIYEKFWNNVTELITKVLKVPPSMLSFWIIIFVELRYTPFDKIQYDSKWWHWKVKVYFTFQRRFRFRVGWDYCRNRVRHIHKEQSTCDFVGFLLIKILADFGTEKVSTFLSLDVNDGVNPPSFLLGYCYLGLVYFLEYFLFSSTIAYLHFLSLYYH